MGKKSDDDEPTQPNDTLAKVLRRCEDGDAYNYVGAELQKFSAELLAAAQRKGDTARGEFRLTLKIRMGRDGGSGVVASVETKKPKLARLETTVFFDADGEVVNGPPERQLTLREVSVTLEKKAL